MSHEYTLQQIVLGYPISVSVTHVGKDLSLQILGGCSPHIGSVTVGHQEKSVPILKTILLPHHRDDVVSHRFAEVLSTTLQKNVCVLCGIHYEEPGKDGLAAILAATEDLLQEILHREDLS